MLNVVVCGQEGPAPHRGKFAAWPAKSPSGTEILAGARAVIRARTRAAAEIPIPDRQPRTDGKTPTFSVVRPDAAKWLSLALSHARAHT